MNRNVNVFGKTIPVWFLTIAIVGAGSMAIAVGPATHVESAPDIQTASDVKIHLQDVDGKINTNVPIAASRTFSALPIEFAADTEVTIDGIATGSSIVTKQKAVINYVLDVSEDQELTFTIDNDSEDRQIFLIKANAPSNVMLDAESGTGTTVHGVTGHNEWLASSDAGTGKTFKMEVSVTDAGFYPIVVELLRVG
jgi:hypothetical protein